MNQEIKYPVISYVVTGVTKDGKRFRKQYSDSFWALGINLWRGSVWKQTIESPGIIKRKRIKSVWNP